MDKFYRIGGVDIIQKQKAVTLIEIMIVMAIILILGGILIPKLVRRGKQTAKEAWAGSEIRQLQAALVSYSGDWGTYPSDDEDGIDGCVNLVEALESENSEGGAYWQCPSDSKDSDGNFVDPWGRPYRYRYKTGSIEGAGRGIGYNIWSIGRDDSDAEDDIKNW